MGELSISSLLLHYKREDVRQAMCDGALDKEIAIRYSDNGYGKRPDMISTPADILEFVKKGATSFHASEELWINAMQLSPSLSRRELEELRRGWDLVLDIDCPYWELSKTTAKLMVKALNDNGVNKSVSIKFSGNKGFHIGVPFEAFPKKINIKGEILEIEKLFPDAARKVALYIVDYIANNYCDTQGNIIIDGKTVISLQKIKELTGKDITELTKRICLNCKKEIKEKAKAQKTDFICTRCENRESVETEDEMRKCGKCNSLMQKIENKKTLCSCGSNNAYYKFNPLSIVDVDTILISSRHLYRMEFSMHEKSGLVSVPFNPQKIDLFEKENAKSENVKVSKFRFLDRTQCIPNEARDLFLKAYDYNPVYIMDEEESKRLENKKEFEVPEKAIPEELFPPCIKKGLSGMEDGKKRFMFALVNFLQSVGWDAEMIEKRIIEWNKKNKDPIREQYILGHLRYQKQHKKNAPPPNCDNNMYYKDLGICFRDSDNLCQKIKNPAQYAKKKEWAIKQNKPKERAKKEKKEKVVVENKENNSDNEVKEK